MARSRRSRASSTPPWLAASISMTSRDPEPPRASSTQLGHLPHGRVGRAFGAVQAAGQDAGGGGFTAAAGAGKQVGVVDPVLPQSRHQRLGDVFLPDDVRERIGTVSAVKGGSNSHRLNPTNRHRHKRPPMHPPEPIYPCYLPVLGEFNRMTPHEGPSTTLPDDRVCPETGGPPDGHALFRARGGPDRTMPIGGTGRRACPAAEGRRLGWHGRTCPFFLARSGQDRTMPIGR